MRSVVQALTCLPGSMRLSDHGLCRPIGSFDAAAECQEDP
jgi:hypothetical protein